MLKLLTGISGTGKTHTVLSSIKKLAQEKTNSIFIVPEQFSAGAETMVYNMLKDELSAYVSVKSFTSLAEDLLKIYGGTALKTMTDAGRVVAVRRAGEKLETELVNYKKHIKNTSFCAMCADVIKELKTAGTTAKHLFEISKNTGESGKKLLELSLIWQTYEAIINGTALDTADRINIATQKLQPNFLQDKHIFIDNFDGFTPVQYTMIEKLITAKECTVTLCCDTQNETQGGFGVFSPVRSTATRLIRLAQKNGVAVQTPKNLTKNHRHDGCETLKAVNEILCTNFDEDKFAADSEYIKLIENEKNSDEALTVTLCTDVYEQCKFVAAQIIKLVKKGACYNDFAVICRESDNYLQAINYEFTLAGIPYFTDEVSTLEYCAHTSFLRAALGLGAKGINSEGVLRLIKTGLCGFDVSDISALENYVYTWEIDAKSWQQPFVNSPSGFGEQTEIDSEEDKILKAAESLRSEAVPKIASFIQKVKYAKSGDEQDLTPKYRCTAQQISRALYELLIDFNGEENTIKMANELEKTHSVGARDEILRTWNSVMSLLDEMNALLGDDIISPMDYDELFGLLLHNFDVGHVPLTQDIVIVTTADRMRLQNPQYCFVLGVSEGEFPKTPGFSGLLTHEDRDFLVQNGIDMPGSFEKRTMNEQMFFYRAMTAPSKGLFLSAIKEENGGGALSSQLEAIVAFLNPNSLDFTLAELANTYSGALDILGAQYRQDTEKTATLISALSGKAPAIKSLQAMKNAAVTSQFTATDLTAIEKTVGSNLTLSPTRIEQYHKCKFSYFLQYVLKIRPRRKAELSPLETGSLVHFLMENALRISGENFTLLTRQELEDMASSLTNEYVKKNMPQTSSRFEYLINRLKEGALNLLEFLQREQRQSSFKPIAFEQAIGGAGAESLQPLKLKTPDGKTVSVVGKIDRVDVMHRDGTDFIRVVDYKTGDKAFNLDEVYCGLNVQMLFYLFMICKNKYKQYENPVASGALYVQGDPALKTVARPDADTPPTYKVDGLVLNDEVVLRGMDKEFTGYFVPVTFGKNGVRASKKLASLEELGNIEKHIESTVILMAKGIYEGEIEAVPLCSSANRPCDYCDYKTVCRHEDGINERQIFAPDNAFKDSVKTKE